MAGRPVIIFDPNGWTMWINSLKKILSILEHNWNKKSQTKLNSCKIILEFIFLDQIYARNGSKKIKTRKQSLLSMIHFNG